MKELFKRKADGSGESRDGVLNAAVTVLVIGFVVIAGVGGYSAWKNGVETEDTGAQVQDVPTESQGQRPTFPPDPKNTTLPPSGGGG